jgi:hypothetical protein
MQAIREAISRGAPLFNAGEIETCAAIYASLAEDLSSSPSLGHLHRGLLNAVAQAPPADASARAWAYRRAFDAVLGDEGFKPRLEAPLPTGFPAPGPVAWVVLKAFPAHRCARTATGGFGTLFQHISTRSIAMTCPVVSTLSPARAVDMAFLYSSPAQGSLGPSATEPGVVVEDCPAAQMLCLGVRGAVRDELRELALAVLAAEAAARKLSVGKARLLGYNSPMVPDAQRYWEVAVEVTPAAAAAGAGGGGAP